MYSDIQSANYGKIAHTALSSVHTSTQKSWQNLFFNFNSCSSSPTYSSSFESEISRNLKSVKDDECLPVVIESQVNPSLPSPSQQQMSSCF